MYRDLVSLHCKQFKGQVGMYVPQDGVIYSDQVYQVCTEPIDVVRNFNDVYPSYWM